ncbi:MAG: hypothetical protein HY287_10730 [Planctomycetes bacterium]|nr:hypothetical protein [Planctomycetota bacterium]MBI3834793.1 hypothetical protein [Planctomycetota bacterium]
MGTLQERSESTRNPSKIIAIQLATSAFTVCVASITSGCSIHSDPYRAWQDGVSRYVVSEGQGDLAVLRQIHDAKPQDSLRPGQRTIGILGTHSAGDDVQAVLVGTRKIENLTWYIFAVADLRQQSGGGLAVKDVRLIAVTEKGEDLFWRTGPSDPESVGRYLIGCPTTLRRPFPASTDVFTLGDVPNGAKVKEERSGAEFSIQLRDATPSGRVATFRG